MSELNQEIIRRLDRLENKIDVFKEMAHMNTVSITNINKTLDMKADQSDVKGVRGNVTVLFSILITAIGAGLASIVSQFTK